MCVCVCVCVCGGGGGGEGAEKLNVQFYFQPSARGVKPLLFLRTPL